MSSLINLRANFNRHGDSRGNEMCGLEESSKSRTINKLHSLAVKIFSELFVQDYAVLANVVEDFSTHPPKYYSSILELFTQ